MAQGIAVFICYKKMLFSQQPTGEILRQKNVEADVLHYLLSEHPDYAPWVDDARLAADHNDADSFPKNHHQR